MSHMTVQSLQELWTVILNQTTREIEDFLTYGLVQSRQDTVHTHLCIKPAIYPSTPNHRINRPYKDAQNRLLWRDKTCPART